MKYTINLENIVADYFNNNPNTSIITQETISQLVKTITTNFSEQWITVYIDDTKNALNHMLSVNHEYFWWDDEKNLIYLKTRNNLTLEIEYYFNLTLDTAIKKTYLQIIENFKEII